MDNKVKMVTIYPFHDGAIPVVKFLDKMNSKYKVNNVVSPVGFGINRKDAGEAYRKNNIGITITSDLETALLTSDVLFITEGKKSMLIYDDILQQMEKAINMGKEIICTIELYEDDLRKLKSLSQKDNVTFTYCNLPRNRIEKKEEHIGVTKMNKINVPVIYIGEVMDGFDGFEMLMKTTVYLKEQGYNVLSIGKPKYSTIFNIESIPDFIYQTDIKDENKVYYFNIYVHELVKKQNPDVIVIQFPGGLMKYNDIITNEFGIYSYLVSQAVTADYFIYCTQYDRVDSKMFKMLSDTFKFRFNCEINAVNITNKGLDASDRMEETDNLPFIWFSQNAVDNVVEKNNYDSLIPVYNCENQQDCIRMYENMIDTLAGYGEALKIV